MFYHSVWVVSYVNFHCEITQVSLFSFNNRMKKGMAESPYLLDFHFGSIYLGVCLVTLLFDMGNRCIYLSFFVILMAHCLLNFLLRRLSNSKLCWAIVTFGSWNGFITRQAVLCTRSMDSVQDLLRFPVQRGELNSKRDRIKRMYVSLSVSSEAPKFFNLLKK